MNDPLTVTGALNANEGLTVTGAGVTIGGSDVDQSLTVNGTIRATQLVTASNGLTVTGAGVTIGTAPAGTTAPTNGQLTVYGAVTATGLVTAKDGLTVTGVTGLTVDAISSKTPGTSLALSGNGDGGVRVNDPLTVTGALNANKGLTVTGGTTSVAALNASDTITANGGLTIPNNATLTINGAIACGGWLPMTITSGWSVERPVESFKDPFGIVHLRGVLKRSVYQVDMPCEIAELASGHESSRIMELAIFGSIYDHGMVSVDRRNITLVTCGETETRDENRRAYQAYLVHLDGLSFST